MLKLGRFTKVKVLFLVLVFVFNFDLFKFSAAILEKGLLAPGKRVGWLSLKKLASVTRRDDDAQTLKTNKNSQDTQNPKILNKKLLAINLMWHVNLSSCLL